MSDTKTLTIYSSDWCYATHNLCRHLETLGLPYEFVNVDENPAALKQIADWNGGRPMRPTVVVNGVVLINPDAKTLADLMDAPTEESA